MSRRMVWGVVAGLGLVFVVAGCALLGNLHPIASFTAAPNSGNSPLSVDFDASASSDPDGTIDAYLWNFGDGQTASATVPTLTHIYTNVQSNPQVYTAILTVTDNDGADDTAVQNITVNP